jgi:hypothetical protein
MVPQCFQQKRFSTLLMEHINSCAILDGTVLLNVMNRSALTNTQNHRISTLLKRIPKIQTDRQNIRNYVLPMN